MPKKSHVVDVSDVSADMRYDAVHGDDAEMFEDADDVLADEIADEKSRPFPYNLFKKVGTRKTYNIEDYPHLKELRLQEAYLFKPDYYKTSNKTYSCILSIFHAKGVLDRFGPFWGLNLLPSGLPKTSKAVLFEQTVRKTDEWVAAKQTGAEKVSEANAVEQARGGTNTTRGKAKKALAELGVVAEELMNGAVYLHTHFRLQVTSPTLKELADCPKTSSRLLRTPISRHIHY